MGGIHLGHLVSRGRRQVSAWRGAVARGNRETEATAERPIKSPPMEIDGRVMSISEFVAYIEGLDMPSPLPTRFFLHHTWKPTRETWRGSSTMIGMKQYYEKQLWRDGNGRLREGWTAGPHLFVADDGIWLFSDIRYDGVGVYGHNTLTRHLEMVGNYDGELPSGATLANTIAALGVLHDKLGLDINRLNFHRDFSTKSCPGWAVTKEWVIPQVARWMEEYRRAKQPAPAPVPQPEPEPVPDTTFESLRQALVAMVDHKFITTDSQTILAEEALKRRLLGPVTYQLPMEINQQGYLVQIFAEALLVPVNKPDDIRSLAELEALLAPDPGQAQAPSETHEQG